MGLLQVISDFVLEFFWDWNQLPYSFDHYKMMRNPSDRELYIKAVEKLNQGSKSESFVLQDGEEVTIFRN